MKYRISPLVVILAILGLEDLIMVPFMLQAHSQPPMAAIVASGVIGVVTIGCIPALIRGRRWSFWVVLVTRVIDGVSAALGAAGGPGAGFKIGGALALLLSVAAIVLLVRSGRRATVGTARAA